MAGVLSDPQLSLFKDQNLVASNDDWEDDDAGAKSSANLATGAFAQAEQDAAILIELDAGVYSAQISGGVDDTGLVIVEVYDVSSDSEFGKLINLSTRGKAGQGADAMVAGFVLDGPKTVLIRASSKILEYSGLAGVMSDPVLELYSEQVLVASNDDWESEETYMKLAYAVSVGAFGQADTDAGLLVTLEAGAYSAKVTDSNGGSGLAIVEVYDLD